MMEELCNLNFEALFGVSSCHPCCIDALLRRTAPWLTIIMPSAWLKSHPAGWLGTLLRDTGVVLTH